MVECVTDASHQQITGVYVTVIDDQTGQEKFGQFLPLEPETPDDDILVAALNLNEVLEREALELKRDDKLVFEPVPPLPVSFSPEGTRAVSASPDGRIKLWDVQRGTLVADIEGHTGSIEHVGWSSDGTCLVSAGEDGSVRIWDAQSGRRIID
jgi:WD40 repeat protein